MKKKKFVDSHDGIFSLVAIGFSPMFLRDLIKVNIGEYINFIQLKIQNGVKLFWSAGSTPIGLNKKMPLVTVLKDFLNIFLILSCIYLNMS